MDGEDGKQFVVTAVACAACTPKQQPPASFTYGAHLHVTLQTVFARPLGLLHYNEARYCSQVKDYNMSVVRTRSFN